MTMETAATAEEKTELRVLRARAAESGRELSDTAAALAGKLAEAGSPRQWARRKAADAEARAWQAARRAAVRSARVGWPKVAVTTGLLVIVAVAVTWQHRRGA